jgi:hypothetical protein
VITPAVERESRVDRVGIKQPFEQDLTDFSILMALTYGLVHPKTLRGRVRFEAGVSDVGALPGVSVGVEYPRQLKAESGDISKDRFYLFHLSALFSRFSLLFTFSQLIPYLFLTRNT